MNQRSFFFASVPRFRPLVLIRKETPRSRGFLGMATLNGSSLLLRRLLGHCFRGSLGNFHVR